MAILSASGYGNSQIIQNSTIKSTTGNKSGVYIPLAWEWTAGGLQGSIFSGVDGKYYDAYTSSSASAKAGDALTCSGWHGASIANWVNSSHPYFGRGGSALFSFSHDNAAGTNLGRASVVCGEGI